MIIDDVDFPQPLLNALRDGKLVIFAGAGVSIGPPARLPDFTKLARLIAEGSGLTKEALEPDDRFLRRLKDAGPDVHRRAVQVLQANDPEPTELHRNLLRLYTSPDAVRIVTTNFDRLFEQSAADLFDPEPNVFQAPALPLGQRFQGIVHIHGAVDDPTEMVLTSQDFGRAYLTEADGWGRRFLVDLFANYTVLFVGYSHQDTIMTYLTPSLPRDANQQRFALVGDWNGDEQSHWRNMGVDPVVFHQAEADDFGGLDSAVAGLADQVRRGTLDWQRQIAEIASGYPPVGPADGERAGIIEHALSEPLKTRFFTDSAETAEWIGWLDNRDHLTALFTGGEPNQRDRILLDWLVSRFTMTHDSTLFALIGRHGNQLNLLFWQSLSWKMQDCLRESPDPAVLTRWVLFLAAAIPKEADEVVLSWLAQACAAVGATDGLLRVYEAMTARLDRVPPAVPQGNWGALTYEMHMLLAHHILPSLPEIAEPVLALTTMRLSSRHAVVTAWEEGDATLHWDNFTRPAIETHFQNDVDSDIAPLIDTARECLEWLARNRADVARVWSERYVGSPAPLLRRLAVHTLSVRTDLSPDDKIAWLIKNCDLHETAAHHEIFRAASIIYPRAGLERRSSLIDAVLAYRSPQDTEPDDDRYTAPYHLTWLHWLNEAAPNCYLTKQTLDDIQKQHPELRPSEHPDLMDDHWTGLQTRDDMSSVVDELLTRSAAEALPDLLAHRPTDQQMFDAHDRWVRLNAVEEVVQIDPSWGLELADAMVATEQEHSDLWHHVIVAWSGAELDQESVRRVLSHLSSNGLHRQHTREVARVLRELVRKAAAAGTTQLPDEANSIAVALHQYAVKVEVPDFEFWVSGSQREVDWLQEAVNHPSGILAEFWAENIALWCRQQDTPPPALNDEHRVALDGIVRDHSVAGKLGRTVLARYLPLLLGVDETWTKQNLIPLLDPSSEDFLSAWDGLTHCRAMAPQAAELLREPFLDAVEHIERGLTGSRQKRFITKYTGMLVWFASDPADEWITKLLTHGSAEARQQFAMQVSSHLRSLDSARQEQTWNSWLKGYWENRLLGVPVQLDDTEIDTMLYWTTLLPAVFPETVDVATQMRDVELQRGIVMSEIGEAGLVGQYPEATAKLLIHLSRTDQKPRTWHRAKEIFDELLQSNLNRETALQLRETIAKIGLW